MSEWTILFGAVSAISVPLNIFLGWLAYRLNQYNAALARPYLPHQIRQGTRLALQGDGWE